VVTPT